MKLSFLWRAKKQKARLWGAGLVRLAVLPCLCAGPLPRTLSHAAIIAVAIIVTVGKGEGHVPIVHEAPAVCK
ncbi:MAG TPA: hypothetical protein PK789_03125 [Thermomonas sp.]|jgi:hypothetical protein|uniref:hypothetical protein n=1 Tax=Thermomonas sp. TaxID=1971895 RepID=UPI002C9E0378|nr:hypothetical protein [Thermomonas sp.]HOV95755.1 hypothetical protein [Thermomonas sp.]